MAEVCFTYPLSLKTNSFCFERHNVTAEICSINKQMRRKRNGHRMQPSLGAENAGTVNQKSENRGRILIASRATDMVNDPRDGEPMLHVVFVHPQIHWNTGNIGRTCLGLGARLHLIKPLGFSLDAKQVRRAGLDYWEHVDVHVYDNWLNFAQGEMLRIGGARYFFTKFGDQCVTEVEWAHDEKIVLVFGSEVDGFDGIRNWLDTEGSKENLVAFPMVDDRFRSFNLSTTASMVSAYAFDCAFVVRFANRCQNSCIQNPVPTHSM